MNILRIAWILRSSRAAEQLNKGKCELPGVKVEEAKPKRIEVHVARTLAPHGPTILGKDEAMQAMTLHAQADLWQHGAATFAALFMAGEMRSPDTEVDRTDVLFYAVMNRGLPLATDLPRLALRPRPGWALHLNPGGALTLTWPHVQPLLLDAPLNLPTGWPEAAAEHGLVLLFVGDTFGLRDHTDGHQTSPGQRSPQAAERGELAAGAITYRRQRQEPCPAVGRAAGEYRRQPATFPRATTAAHRTGRIRSRLVRSSG